MALQNEIFSALSYATSKGYQVNPDALALLKGLDGSAINILKIIQEIVTAKVKQRKAQLISTVIGAEDIKRFIDPKKNVDSGPIEQLFSIIQDPTPNVNTAEGVEGYAALFSSRFEKTMRILAQRPDSKRISKISSVKHRASTEGRNSPKKKNNDHERDGRESSLAANSTYLVAGLVMEKRSKKNGIEIVVDDYTGTIAALAASDETRKQASTIALDQMVMLEIEGMKGMSGGTMAVKSIISPDIPDHIANRSKSEAYAIFISDMHVGSRYFMESEFKRFLEWLALPPEENDIVNKIKFLCIGGDIIDGIGIFPNQDKELVEMDTQKQMAHAAGLLAKIPKHIKVFIIPGNHDPGRRALPQPAFPKGDSGGLYDLENCTILGNPGTIELNGVKVLMYHGQGLDDTIATTPGMSYSKPAEAMKVLLKARHLSPVYGGRTPIAPEKEDMMVITEVPDIFHSGHVHVTDVASYRGTLIINSGAWQAQTKYQQTMGIVPTPGIAIAVNLATLQPYQKDFN